MISICIPTYKRPQQLQALLHTLLTEVVRPEPIEIVICDNDAERSAQIVVDAVSRTADVAVRYFSEPVQNISLARNRTVAEARGEWIAFIDDDELPTNGWLVALKKTAENFAAHGIMGPVIPRLPKEASRWAVETMKDNRLDSDMCEGKLLSLSEVATGNALIRTSVLKNVPGPFDPVFGSTGGEDTLTFGWLIYKYGVVFRLSAEAIVFEDIPFSRCSPIWILKRFFRGGQAWVDIQGILFGRAKRMYSIVRALFIICGMTLVLPLIAVSPKRMQITFAKKFATLLGQFSVVFSYRYSEYKKIQ